MKLLAPFIAVLLTVGCTTSKVITTAPGTYMVNSSGAGFSTGSVRANVFKAANKYCASKGLEPAPVSFKAIPGVLARNPPTADLIFICLEHGDPAINNSALTEAEQLDVQQNINVQSSDTSPNEKDLYTEIKKLDDLRDQGLLTDEEFEAAKKKLLNAQ